MRERIARGDFQTPPALARAIAQHLRHLGVQPAAVVEPTCGRGAFLAAAAANFPSAPRFGYELEPDHARQARATDSEITVADAFTLDWEAAARRWPRPVLIVGNPPWVLTPTLGRVAADHSPARRNPGLRGLDALTGAATFDVSEWILRRLHAAAPDAVIAVLCKTSVARRLLADGLPLRGLWHIDARRWFGVSVDAGLVVVDPKASPGRCPVHEGLDAPPSRVLTVQQGVIIEDADAWARYGHLAGEGPLWRSGIKHDAARVLELKPSAGSWVNGLGEPVDVEPHVLWPLAKGGDLHHGRPPSRRLLVPQQALDADPGALADHAPRAWAYLQRHRALLDGRRSRVWQRAPRFGIFGVGPYTFASHKVAVAGLYPQARFRLLEPVDGRPVLVDDTSYFLSFSDPDAAGQAWSALCTPQAAGFLRAQVADGAKRPITARLLRSLRLEGLRQSPGQVTETR